MVFACLSPSAGGKVGQIYMHAAQFFLSISFTRVQFWHFQVCVSFGGFSLHWVSIFAEIKPMKKKCESHTPKQPAQDFFLEIGVPPQHSPCIMFVQ
jgi:hypothetical protein